MIIAPIAPEYCREVIDAIPDDVLGVCWLARQKSIALVVVVGDGLLRPAGALAVEPIRPPRDLDDLFRQAA